jgi:hypothetical protein
MAVVSSRPLRSPAVGRASEASPPHTRSRDAGADGTALATSSTSAFGVRAGSRTHRVPAGCAAGSGVRERERDRVVEGELSPFAPLCVGGGAELSAGTADVLVEKASQNGTEILIPRSSQSASTAAASVTARTGSPCPEADIATPCTSGSTRDCRSRYGSHSTSDSTAIERSLMGPYRARAMNPRQAHLPRRRAGKTGPK